jgi:amidase
MKDAFGAFCEFQEVRLEGAPARPLSGLTFGAKDTFDIAGQRTGNGSPAWLARARPAAATAPLVARFVEAGATLVGKTHCDELCFSIEGENVHYGTPINPAAPDRIPGGSSSGSAVAVAAGLVDFALGTDAGGSVRLPASFCGIYGLRSTHSRIPAEGVARLAPSIGSAGWFARDPETMSRISAIAFAGTPHRRVAPKRILFATDMAELADRTTAENCRRILSEMFGREIETVDGQVWGGARDALFADLRTIQGSEAWSIYGKWIRDENPAIGPAIRSRFEWASTIDAADVGPARTRRECFSRSILDMLDEDTLISFPTAPGPAPMLKSPAAVLDPYRVHALKLSALAGLVGVPQLSIPVGSIGGAPIGLSLVGPKNSDLGMVDLVAGFSKRR